MNLAAANGDLSVRLVRGDHAIGRTERQPLGKERNRSNDFQFRAAPASLARFRNQIVMIEDKLHSKHLEETANHEKEIGWICGLNHIETAVEPGHQGQEERGGDGDSVLEKVTQESGTRREWVSINRDVFDDLIQAANPASRKAVASIQTRRSNGTGRFSTRMRMRLGIAPTN